MFIIDSSLIDAIAVIMLVYLPIKIVQHVRFMFKNVMTLNIEWTITILVTSVMCFIALFTLLLMGTFNVIVD